MMVRDVRWITKEAQEGRQFWVVQEAQLPRLWGRSLRREIFDRGVFPWDRIITDLPGTYRGEEGSLGGQRAAACRLIDDQRNPTMATPIMMTDDIEDRLVDDPRYPGEKAVQVDVVPKREYIGQPRILVPHYDHAIVKIAWICNVPCTMVNMGALAPQERERVEVIGGDPDRCWQYYPRFDRPISLYRYILAFWELPVVDAHARLVSLS